MKGRSATVTAAGSEPLHSERQDLRAPNPEQRFTIDGSPALEKRLAVICDQVLKEVQAIVPRPRLEAVLLGGGYGRGEGGVLRTHTGDEPYNDIEFYVFLRGNRVLNERRHRPTLDQLGERMSSDAGIHVEFKVDSFARFRVTPVSMFSYDLVAGHRILFAPDGVFAGCKQHLTASRIPLHEATRLLFNRCTGLLLVKELLQQPDLRPQQSDFIGRNLAKAELALGDVVLTTAGEYHWSCLTRHERLKAIAGSEKLPWIRDVLQHHASGRDFKLHPSRTLKTTRQFHAEFLAISDLARQLWLWLEGIRLGQYFASVTDYALSPAAKCSGCSLPRAVALNASTFGVRSLFERQAFAYPRERLLNALPLLLWEESLKDLRLKRFLQNQLRTPASDWQSLVAAYKAIWPRFS